MLPVTNIISELKKLKVTFSLWGIDRVLVGLLLQWLKVKYFCIFVKCCYKWKEIIHCNKGCVQSNVTLCLGGGGPPGVYQDV